MEKVTYEQPLNERIRTFLRLEMLFDKVQFHMLGESPFETRAAITGLLDIINIFARSELKSEVMKELERHNLVLARLEQSPGVDISRLRGVLNKIEPLLEKLRESTGQIGAEVRREDFLNAIRQRNTIPGGDSGFDLPYYHYWLSRPLEQRKSQLSKWLNDFSVIHQSIALALTMIRDSANPIAAVAKEGFFRRTLDPNVPCQMIRITLPADCGFFPEISAGKHRFSVRFLDGVKFGRPQQVVDDVEFDMVCCVI